MEVLSRLSLGRKLVLGGGLLLLVDTFFAWQKVSVGFGGVSIVSATANAWHGFWGVFLGLLTIAILAWVAARAFGVELPVAAPDGLVTLALGALILAFAVLKNLTDSHSAWASYVGIVLAAGVAAGAWLVFQDSGEALPSRAGMSTAPAAGTEEQEPPSAPTGPTPV